MSSGVTGYTDSDQNDSMNNSKLSDEVHFLVTGASGGLGRLLVKHLISEGKKVRVFIRRLTADIPKGVEVAIGDLGNPEAVEQAVRGAKIVIHAGAAMKGGWAEHQCATVNGTRNVLEACRKHNIDKLIHISSMSVVDWAGQHKGIPVSEETPLEPRPHDRGAYTRAKLEAETLVMEYYNKHNLPVVVLRPGQIFGGTIPLLTPAVARRLAGCWMVLGNGTLELPLVYIDDVVDAIILAVKSDLRNGEIIQIADKESITQNEILQSTVGRGAAIICVPRVLVFLIGGISQLLLKPIGKKSPLSIYRLKSALARLKFQSNKAEAMLGWKPEIGIYEGMRRSVQGANSEKK